MAATPRYRLIRLRELTGKTRAEFALMIGVTEPHIWRVELGERDASYTLMKKWVEALEALGCSASPSVFFTSRDAA